jgi:hypothetical protein
MSKTDWVVVDGIQWHHRNNVIVENTWEKGLSCGWWNCWIFLFLSPSVLFPIFLFLNLPDLDWTIVMSSLFFCCIILSTTHVSSMISFFFWFIIWFLKTDYFELTPHSICDSKYFILTDSSCLTKREWDFLSNFVFFKNLFCLLSVFIQKCLLFIFCQTTF